MLVIVSFETFVRSAISRGSEPFLIDERVDRLEITLSRLERFPRKRLRSVFNPA